jgi:hypothetical protein
VPPVCLDRTGAGLADGEAHLVKQRFVHAAAPRDRGGDEPRGTNVCGQRRERYLDGGHIWQAGRRYFSDFLAAMAASTVPWMPNTFVSPVILKI